VDLSRVRKRSDRGETMSNEQTEVELELDEEVVEYLEQDHIDADKLINAILTVELYMGAEDE